MNHIPYEVMQPLQALVYRSCLLMNEESWADYLGLCDAKNFRYRVVNYSPEIRREQCWADRDYKSMKSAFDLMPRHNSDHSKLTRQATVYTVDYDPDKKEARVVSGLTIYRTQLDGTNSYLESGQTSVYVIGTYSDLVRFSEEGPVLVERTVRLDTRQLDVGSHKPF